MPLIIDSSNINKYLKNTAPYVFVDYAEVFPGQSAKGEKLFTYNEILFNRDLSKKIFVPQALYLEALIQTAALSLYALQDPLIDFIYLNKLTKASFVENIISGEKLEIKAEIQKNRRGFIDAFGESFVLRDKKSLKICSANFQFLVPGILSSLSPSK